MLVCLQGTGNVYIARKNGGTDDGTLYALKAMKIPTEFVPRVLSIRFKALNSELEVAYERLQHLNREFNVFKFTVSVLILNFDSIPFVRC